MGSHAKLFYWWNLWLKVSSRKNDFQMSGAKQRLGVFSFSNRIKYTHFLIEIWKLMFILLRCSSGIGSLVQFPTVFEFYIIWYRSIGPQSTKPSSKVPQFRNHSQMTIQVINHLILYSIYMFILHHVSESEVSMETLPMH